MYPQLLAAGGAVLVIGSSAFGTVGAEVFIGKHIFRSVALVGVNWFLASGKIRLKDRSSDGGMLPEMAGFEEVCRASC
jgi:hypothetical protein